MFVRTHANAANLQLSRSREKFSPSRKIYVPGWILSFPGYASHTVAVPLATVTGPSVMMMIYFMTRSLRRVPTGRLVEMRAIGRRQRQRTTRRAEAVLRDERAMGLISHGRGRPRRCAINIIQNKSHAYITYIHVI